MASRIGGELETAPQVAGIPILLNLPAFAIVMLITYAVLLVLLYRQTVPDREVPGGILPGLGTEAVPIAARYAAITAIPLSLVFLWADRFRPQRFWVWLMTFGWGACVATFVSAQVNTWAAGHLSIIGDGDPAAVPAAESSSMMIFTLKVRPSC